MAAPPYASLVNQTLGPPLYARTGDEELGMLAALAADEVNGGFFRNMFRQGGPFRRQNPGGGMDPMQALAVIRRALQSGGGGGGGMGFLGDADFIGAFGGDGTDAADDAELDGDEADVEGLGADDEESAVGALGADGDEAEVGVLGAIGDRIEKLNAKIQRLEMKLSMTPAFKIRKRQRLTRAIARAKQHLARKEAKRDRKAAKVAAKFGLPAAALATAAGAGLISASAIGATRASAARAAAEHALTGIVGVTPRTTYGGEEVPLVFNDATTGAPVSNVTVAAGAGLRTAAINMITPVISYSEFEVIGIDVNFSIRQDNFTPAGGTVPVNPNEIVTRLLLTSAVVGGSINLMYGAAIDVGMAAQIVSYPGFLGFARSIRGLRANVNQDKTNQTTIAFTFRQEITTTTTINAAITAALITRPRNDTSARRAAN